MAGMETRQATAERQQNEAAEDQEDGDFNPEPSSESSGAADANASYINLEELASANVELPATRVGTRPELTPTNSGGVQDQQAAVERETEQAHERNTPLRTSAGVTQELPVPQDLQEENPRNQHVTFAATQMVPPQFQVVDPALHGQVNAGI